jgi:DDE superfamily endonuclease
VELEYIPKGCTSVAQPVDVGFNSQFKYHVKTRYMRWQIVEYRQHYADNPNNPNLKLPLPSTRNIVDWVLSAYKEIDEATIRQTFLFFGLVMPVGPNLNVAIDDGYDNDDDENKSSDNEIIVRNPQRIEEL